MAKINFDKHIYEGWTVRDFIEELEPQLDMIQTGNSCYRPMRTPAAFKAAVNGLYNITVNYHVKGSWTADNQPYYKKPVTDVVNYFCNRYGIA